MRKSVILLVLALSLFFPKLAHAQLPVFFEQLDVQFWPDYDKPAVLVIYDFVISAETPLPAQVSVRMPAGAQLFAVARRENNGLMNVEHDLPVQVGNYSVVSFAVTDRLTYRVEFYVPYVLQEKQRNFIYIWPGDYAVTRLTFWLQEPQGATNITTEPVMTSRSPGSDGFTYQSLALQDVKAGESLSFKFSYSNDQNGTFTGRAEPAAPLEQSQPFMSFLPWILGGVGVTLIVGGGLWYWLSGRSGNGSERSRKRHVSREAEEDSEATAYCSQCGRRAQTGDRFCRACGTKLRL